MFVFGEVNIVFNECQKFLICKIIPSIKTSYYLLETKLYHGSCGPL